MILNINKPKGWTSYDVVRKVKSSLDIKKVGHAGTLDPLAEGVLVILTGKDTKKQEEIMRMEKEYEFEMALGLVSETYDLEGPLYIYSPGSKELEPFSVENAEKLLKRTQEFDVNINKVDKVFKNYVGEIHQRVPAYSAVKKKGKPLYKYARKGLLKREDLPIKKVTIYSIEIEDLSSRSIPLKGKDLYLPVVKGKVVCGKGVYIRSLVHDVGVDLGTGAVLTKLVRTRVGEFKLEDSSSVRSLSQFAQAQS